MRRLIAPVTVAGMMLLGFVGVGTPAQASVFPGTNGKIVFGQVFPNYGSTIDPDGSHLRAIGPVGSTSCNTWSADGTKVLCNVWSADGVPQPATANPDGSGFRLLDPNLPLDLFCLNWSPDGTRLLCHSEGMTKRADAGLYTVRSSDAGDLVRVTATPSRGFDNGYGYSPDGSRILFARFDSSDQGTLYSVKPNGHDLLKLSPSRVSVIDLDFFDRIGADWSPSGSKVVFAARVGVFHGVTGQSALFVVRADGTGLRRLTNPRIVEPESAQWSPSGNRLAFQGRNPSFASLSQVWTVRPDGTGLEELTIPSPNGSLSVTPVWSPDGTKLLFQRLFFLGFTLKRIELRTVNADGTGATTVTELPNQMFYSWGTAPTG
jgi:TolB protein